MYSLVWYFPRRCIKQTKQKRVRLRELRARAVSLFLCHVCCAHGPGVCLRWSVKGRAQINAPVAGSAPQFSLNSSTLPASPLLLFLLWQLFYASAGPDNNQPAERVISRRRHAERPTPRHLNGIEIIAAASGAAVSSNC